MRFNFFDWFKRLNKNKMDIEMIEEKQKIIKCALIIGHKQSSKGAYNKTYEISEFDFNEELAKQIENSLKISDKNIKITRIYRRTYSSLPSDVNELNPDFIISLHCNAFNKIASGSEVLYYHRSKISKQFADILQQKFVKFLELTDRGSRGKTSEDRGGYLLKKTQAPCIIAEPFFIDNDDDYKKIGLIGINKLIESYRSAISDMALVIKKVNRR